MERQTCALESDYAVAWLQEAVNHFAALFRLSNALWAQRLAVSDEKREASNLRRLLALADANLQRQAREQANAVAQLQHEHSKQLHAMQLALLEARSTAAATVEGLKVHVKVLEARHRSEAAVRRNLPRTGRGCTPPTPRTATSRTASPATKREQANANSRHQSTFANAAVATASPTWREQSWKDLPQSAAQAPKDELTKAREPQQDMQRHDDPTRELDFSTSSIHPPVVQLSRSAVTKALLGPKAGPPRPTEPKSRTAALLLLRPRPVATPNPATWLYVHQGDINLFWKRRWCVLRGDELLIGDGPDASPQSAAIFDTSAAGSPTAPLRVLQVDSDTFQGHIGPPGSSVQNFGFAVTVEVTGPVSRAQVHLLPAIERSHAAVLRFCADSKRDSLVWQAGFKALIVPVL
jgi:hypothetical protein